MTRASDPAEMSEGRAVEKSWPCRASVSWFAALAVCIAGCSGPEIRRQEARLLEVVTNFEAGRRPHVVPYKPIHWSIPEHGAWVMARIMTSMRLADGSELYLQPMCIMRVRKFLFFGIDEHPVRSWVALVRENKTERTREVVWVSPLYSAHRKRVYGYSQLCRVGDRGAMVTLWKLPEISGMEPDEGWGRGEPRAVGARRALEVTLDAKGEVVAIRDLAKPASAETSAETEQKSESGQ